MPHFGPTELVIILVLVMMIFGVGRLPEVGGAIGKGIAGFRRQVSDREEPVRSGEEKT
jgi:sec-independent protein translocase protein TatA